MGQDTPKNCGAALRALIDRSGLTYREAAIRAGFAGSSSIQRYIGKDSHPQPLDIQLLRKFVPALVGRGTPPITRRELILLSGFDDLGTSEEFSSNILPITTETPTFAPAEGAVDVPIMGVGVGGSDGDFSLNGQVSDYTKRPSGAANNKAVFAIYIAGSSMEPKFDHGELLYINPARPARIGEFVLVELHPPMPGEPGPALIKRLEARTATKLILRQHNPDKRIELPLDRVLRVMPVMEQDELIG